MTIVNVIKRDENGKPYVVQEERTAKSMRCKRKPKVTGLNKLAQILSIDS